MIFLWFAIAMILGYFIGNVNFARIVTWTFRKKDITKVGSKNPGMTNVMRTQGLGLALLTMCFEFIKGGLPSLIFAVILNRYYPGVFYVADLLMGLSIMLGQIYPVIYKFQGGKGVAVFVGLFFFSPLWWVALILFLLFAVVTYFFKYGAHINIPYMFCMAIAITLYNLIWIPFEPYYWIAIILIWGMICLELFTHRKNLQRIFEGTENKIDFKQRLFELFGKQVPKEKKEAEQKPEKEIVVEDDKKEE